MRNLILLLFIVTGVPLASLQAAEDLRIMDFDDGSYGGWKIEGDAFGNKPIDKTKAQTFRMFSGYDGAGFVASGNGRETKPTGSLTSPEFVIQRDCITMRIAGGPDQKRLGVKVMVAGQEVGRASATKGNYLDDISIAVKEHKGKKAQIVVFDNAEGWWGYIAVDQLRQSDTKRGYEPVEKIIDVTEELVLIPCAAAGSAQRLEIFDEAGTLLHTVTASLAAYEQDVAFWSYLDVSDYIGKKVNVKLSVKSGSDTAKMIECADEPRCILPKYDEKYRPQFHFSQLKGWNNDPNGMVYYDGRYHLFWQCNPVGTGWGNMYWGHASSPDMVNWTEHKRALRCGAGKGGTPLEKRHPAMATGACFSGSGNVDHNNATGLNIDGKKTLLLFNSDMNAGVSAFYSHDGINFKRWMKKYPLGISGRDAKFVYHEPTKKWVAVSCLSNKEHGHHFPIFTSTDLQNWTLEQNFKDVHECPEFFELAVDGAESNKRWVLMEASSEYFVGEFNGKKFVPDYKEKQVTMIPRACYAGQCFSDSPGGRVVYIGWAGIVTEDMPFNQGFTIPMNLTLRTVKDGGVHLFANPVKEVETLRKSAEVEDANIELNSDRPSYSKELGGELYDICLTLQKQGNPRTATIQLEKMSITYDFGTEKFGHMAAPLIDGRVSVRILVDRPTMEVFMGDGYSYHMHQRKNLSGNKAGKITITIDAPAGSGVTVERLKAYPMKSIWQK